MFRDGESADSNCKRAAPSANSLRNADLNQRGRPRRGALSGLGTLYGQLFTELQRLPECYDCDSDSDRVHLHSTEADRRSPRVHDRCGNDVDPVLDLISRIPHRFRSGSFALHGNWLGALSIFHDSNFTYDPGRYDRAFCARDSQARASRGLRASSSDSSPDLSDVALRFGHRRDCLFDALSSISNPLTKQHRHG
jgi:hypothetical protein